LVAVLALVPGAGASSSSALEAKLASAREEAGSISASLQASQEQLAAAQAEAACSPRARNGPPS
jgi:hypothetical protein